MGQYEWIIGVVLITVGSIGNNLGNNLMSLGFTEEKKMKAEMSKKAAKIADDGEDVEKGEPKHINEETKDALDGTNDGIKTEEKPKKSWWLIGTIIFVFGALFTFAAFGFGAQSLLAAMESIQFISNVFFVYFVHGQKVTTRMIISTLCIVAGNILVVIFSSHAAQNLKSADINYLYLNNLAYQIYAILAFLLLIGNYFLCRHYYNSRVVLKLPPLWRHGLIEPLSYTIYSTILGTQAVLQSKTLAMLLKETFSNENQFTQPTVYIVLVVWLIFVSFWLNRLNRALDLFPPLFIIPVMQVFFVFFAILSGGIFFEEFIGFSAAQYAGFVVGVILIFIGVYGLAPADAEVFAEEDRFSDQIRPKKRASKLIEGQIFFQLPPNLPDSPVPVNRKSFDFKKVDLKEELKPEADKLLEEVPGLEERPKPLSAGYSEPAGLNLPLPQTGTRKVFKRGGSAEKAVVAV